MQSVSDLDARQACEWLATAVYSLMDHGHYAETAALFSEDAIWLRGDTEVQGPKAILAALYKRPEDQLSRHLVTNVLVRVTSATEAEATAIFLPLRGPKRPDGTVPMPTIAGAGDLAFKFIRGSDGWRISQLLPRFVFKD